MRKLEQAMIFAFSSVLVFVSGCSVISKDIRQQVDTSVGFETVLANPAAYVGRMVLFGGYLVSIQNLPEKTTLTVLQTPLGSQDRPETPEKSAGRFVVVSDGFLDPAVYQAGLGITVAGTVIGPETVQIDQVPYPTFGVKPVQMHLWPIERGGYYNGSYYFDNYDPYYYNPAFFYPYYGPFYPWPYYYPVIPPRHHHHHGR